MRENFTENHSVLSTVQKTVLSGLSVPEAIPSVSIEGDEWGLSELLVGNPVEGRFVPVTPHVGERAYGRAGAY